MLVPGLKRTSLDGVDLLQVEQEHSTREQQQQQAPRRPATPPLLRLRSISEHHSHTEDEYINSNDVYNSSNTAADFSLLIIWMVY